MCHKKGFPRYDDTQHIDSNAASKRPTPPRDEQPRVDPAATAYTEMYVEPQQQ